MHSRLILLLMVAAFGSAAVVRVADPLLPALVEIFRTSTAKAAQTVTLCSLAYGVMQLVFGPLGDRFGKLELITLACFGCALGTLGSALSPSIEWLIAFRLFTGAAAAALVPLSMALIGDLVPFEQRFTILARYVSGAILGIVAGQFLSGLLADLLDWRAPFLFLTLIFILIGALLAAECGRRPRAPAAQVDRDSVIGRYWSVLGTGWSRVILIVVFIEGAAALGTSAFVPTYLSVRYGLSLTGAGAVLAMFGAGGLIYTMLARRINGRLSEGALVLGGAGLLAVGFGAVAALGEAWAPAVPALFVCGLGYYMMHTVLQTHATQMTPEARGTAVSLFAAGMFSGNAAGAALSALAIEAGQPRLPFAVAAVALAALGVGLHQALRRRARGAWGAWGSDRSKLL